MPEENGNDSLAPVKKVNRLDAFFGITASGNYRVHSRFSGTFADIQGIFELSVISFFQMFTPIKRP